jgi:AraC-like DNA-binding protein
MDRISDATKYVELSLHEAGREVCVPDKIFSYTPKTYHLFHYIETGKGTLEYKGVTYNLHAGQIFYIAPGDKPFYKPDPNDPWSYVWLGFSGSNAARFLGLAGLSSSSPIYNDPDRKLKPFFEAVENEKRAKGVFDLTALGYAYQLFGELISTHLKVTPEVDAKKRHVESAKEFIHNNYAFDISAGDIAKSVGVSPNYLANIFREVENSSPKKYLIQVRMEQAAVLLSTHQYKIKEVAKMVAYPNQLHFSNAFHKYYGVSPLQYAKSKGAKKIIAVALTARP